ncbi:MAG: hypothetical protein M3O28_03210 [Actinomycetota bacterium]|nr:hypothetical protein [Actinomycetota bacterium]
MRAENLIRAHRLPFLLLRHQPTLSHREFDARPKTSWADRALTPLTLDVIPIRHRGGLRLIVTPETVLRRLVTSSLAAGPRNRVT